MSDPIAEAKKMLERQERVRELLGRTYESLDNQALVRDLLAHIEAVEAMCASYAATIGECNAENAKRETRIDAQQKAIDAVRAWADRSAVIRIVSAKERRLAVYGNRDGFDAALALAPQSNDGEDDDI